MRRQHISILAISALGLVAICMSVIVASGIFPAAVSQALSNSPQGKVSANEFSAAVDAQKKADAKSTRTESARQRFQELSAKLQSLTGTAPVIVQLSVAFRPEGEMQQEAERLAQRAAIRQAQDAVLNSVFGGAPASLKRYVYVPYLAVSINEAELTALQASPLVLDIHEDIPIPIAQTQAPSLPLIGASNAWSRGYNGEGATIAILDTGVDKNHASLTGKVIREACFSTNNPDLNISSICTGGATVLIEDNAGLNCSGMAGCDHGTSVAGVAAGVAPGAKLISIQVNSVVNNAEQCGGPASCIFTNPSDLISGLEHVYRLWESNIVTDIAAVNVSLARDRFTGSCDADSLKFPIDNLRSVGIATVVASGNEGYEDAVGLPACVSTSVSVGATGDGQSFASDAVPPYSNSIAPNPLSALRLNLLAPGYYPAAPVPGVGTTDVWGTSIAAAHVSGAWAILKQQKPKATVFDVLNKLRNSGTPVVDERNNVEAPRVNIDAALDCIQNVDTNRWRGEYFSNEDLTGDPVMARDDGGGTFFSMSFNGGAPDAICGPGAEKFSVRWTRRVEFARGVYRFSVTADDGVRLYVANELKIDAWDGPAGVIRTESVFLEPGNPEIRLEFRQHTGPASVNLSWETICVEDVPANSWKGEYFKDAPSNPNVHLAGSPLMVRNDGTDNGLNINWGDGGPSSECMFGGDNFSARWTRDVFFTGGAWGFTVGGDNGVRLYVDNQLIYNRWTETVGTEFVSVELFEGLHQVKLEFFEITGGAWVSLSWAPAPPNPPSNLVATPISISQISLSWTDHSNFEHGFKIERWNGSSYVQVGTVGANINTIERVIYVDPGLAPATTYHYQVRAYNSVGDSGYTNSSGTTTFPCDYAISPLGRGFNEAGGPGTITVSTAAGCSWSAASDSSWIRINFGEESGVGNGNIGYFVQHYNVTNGLRTGNITIAGRTFGIVQEGPPPGCPDKCCTCLSESSQRAALDTSVTDGKPTGLTARYFDNTTLSGQPTLQRTDAIINFDWAGARPDAPMPADRFSARWSGRLAAPSSEAYTFHLYSDDGARLWVNNRLVIDRWKAPFEPQTSSAPIELKIGEKVDIRLEYYDVGGNALIQLLWSSASTPRQIIPRRHLYPEASTDKSAPADSDAQTGMLSPGSDAGPKATRPYPSGWMAAPFNRAGLALLIAGCVLALLLPVSRRQSPRR
jgi:subtilisin